jgi:hypothetical protein
MRIFFAIVAVSILSTSAHARECYRLPWAERGECIRSDPTFPVRYGMCRDLTEERGFKGSGLRGKGRFFGGCMRELSRLSMQELSRKTQLFGVEVAAWRPVRTARAD